MKKIDELNEPTSCWNKAADDEPLFVLRGIDVAAPAVVAAWIKERKRLGKNIEGDDQTEEAEKWIASVMTPAMVYKIGLAEINVALDYMRSRFMVTKVDELVYEHGDSCSLGISFQCLLGEGIKQYREEFYFVIGWRQFDGIGFEIGEDGDIVEINHRNLMEQIAFQLLCKNIDDEFPFAAGPNLVGWFREATEKLEEGILNGTSAMEPKGFI